LSILRTILVAWVEGKDDCGVGEFIEYSFDMTTVEGEHHLGITQIILANGYKRPKKPGTRIRELKN
jgi:hypothetical protein